MSPENKAFPYLGPNWIIGENIRFMPESLNQ